MTVHLISLECGNSSVVTGTVIQKQRGMCIHDETMPTDGRSSHPARTWFMHTAEVIAALPPHPTKTRRSLLRMIMHWAVVKIKNNRHVISPYSITI